MLGIAFALGSDGAPTPNGVTVAESPRSRTQYAYAYDIRDPQSGAFSSKKETRDGDIVYGNYVVEDPDGSRRVVYYSNDGTRGSNRESSQRQVQDKDQPVPVLAVPVYLTSPPAQPPVHQVQLTPFAISLATAILARAPPEHEALRYETVLTSPGHSYSYWWNSRVSK